MNIAGLLVLLAVIAACIVFLGVLLKRPTLPWWAVPVLAVAIALVGIGVLMGHPQVSS